MEKTTYNNPLLECPECKGKVSLEPDSFHGYNIGCDNCYDVDFIGGEDNEYKGNKFGVWGSTKQDALDQWSDFVDDYLYVEQTDG